MRIHGLTPVLNVSNLAASFAWFRQLGWQKHWDYGDPPDFGSVINGASEIFLCLDGQGSRGTGAAVEPFANTGGTWMSWWLASPAEVDDVYTQALQSGITVTCPPTDFPWHVRECHLLHPDGHCFRVSANLGD